MKTPLMELIEWIQKEPYMISRSDTIAKATELLEKERATIEQSWEQGCLTGEGIGEMITNGSDYYTKTFTNESK